MGAKRKHPTMEGNKNPQIWTYERAVKLFELAIEMTEEKDKKDPDEYRFDFIGEVSRELNSMDIFNEGKRKPIIHHQTFSYLSNQFPELSEMLLLLKSNLQSNCYFNTKKNKINTAVGIINLKSNHKWTDTNNGNKDDETKPTPPVITFSE